MQTQKYSSEIEGNYGDVVLTQVGAELRVGNSALRSDDMELLLDRELALEIGSQMLACYDPLTVGDVLKMANNPDVELDGVDSWRCHDGQYTALSEVDTVLVDANTRVVVLGGETKAGEAGQIILSIGREFDGETAEVTVFFYAPEVADLIRFGLRGML
jgi:hypothetical protein